MKITVTYKNDNKLTFELNYLYFENDEIILGIYSRVHSLAIEQTHIPLKNIKNYLIENEVK